MSVMSENHRRRDSDLRWKFESFFYSHRKEVVLASRQMSGFKYVDWSHTALSVEFDDGTLIYCTPFYDCVDGVPIEMTGNDGACTYNEVIDFDGEKEWVLPDQPVPTFRRFWLLIQLWKVEYDASREREKELETPRS